jgi:hypothetical protein
MASSCSRKRLRGGAEKRRRLEPEQRKRAGLMAVFGVPVAHEDD